MRTSAKYTFVPICLLAIGTGVFLFYLNQTEDNIVQSFEPSAGGGNALPLRTISEPAASKADAQSAIDILKHLLHSGAGEAEVISFFSSLNETEWNLLALEFKDILESLRQEHQNSEILAAFGIFIDLWTQDDHLATLGYLNTISKMQLDFDYDVYESIPLYHWLQTDPEHFRITIESLSANVANEMADGIAEPLGAHYLRVLTKLYFESGHEQEWLEWAVHQEQQGNVDTAIVVLASISQYAGPSMIEPVAERLKLHDTDIRLGGAISVFSSNYVNHQSESALNWMESLNVAPRHAALQFSFESLAAENPTLAIEWLNDDEAIQKIGGSEGETDLNAHEIYDLLVTTLISTVIRNQKNLEISHLDMEQSIKTVRNPELKSDLIELLNRTIK